MAHEDEIQHLEKIIKEKSRRLRELEAQQTRFGYYTPPYISMEIEDVTGELVAHLGEQLHRLQEQPATPETLTKIQNWEGELQSLQQRRAELRRQREMSPAIPQPAPPPAPALPATAPALPKEWLIAAIVAALLLVGVVGYLLLANRPPNPTPPAQAVAPTSTLTPPVTPTPTLVPMPSHGVNIAVAEFIAVTGDTPLTADDGRDLRDALVAEMESLPAALRPAVRSIEIVPDMNQVDRESYLGELTKQLRATMVLYGRLEPDGDSYLVYPEFFISPDIEGFEQYEDILGPTEFGKPVRFTPPFKADINAELNTRIEALKYIFEGVALLAEDRSADAYGQFETARNVLKRTGYTSGLEVIQLLLGAVKINQYKITGGLDLTSTPDPTLDPAILLAEAEKEFEAGLKIDPGYARLFLGLGAVSLEKAKISLYAPDATPEASLADIVQARDWYLQALTDTATIEQSPYGYVKIKARFGVAETYLADYEYYVQQFTQAFEAGDEARQQSAEKAALTVLDEAKDYLQQVISAYYKANEPTQLALLAGQAQMVLGKLAFDEANYWQATGQPDRADFNRVTEECNNAQEILKQPELEKNKLALNFRASCLDWQAVAALRRSNPDFAEARRLCDEARQLGESEGVLDKGSLDCLKLLETMPTPDNRD